jgi:hypothetical protein
MEQDFSVADRRIAEAHAQSAADGAAFLAEAAHTRATEEAAALGIVGIVGTQYSQLAHVQDSYEGRPIAVTGHGGTADGMLSSQFGSVPSAYRGGVARRLLSARETFRP